MTNQPFPISNYLTLPEVQDLLQEIAAPEDTLHIWLAQLVLLNNIPFQNLVPDTRVLPSESLRFFYLDPSWLDALMDGALSVGNHTSLEEMFTQTMANVVKQAGSAVAATIRKQLLGLEPNFTGQPDPNNLLSGMMLRSAIVADFPGLQIIPTHTDSSISLTPLRFEKIGPDLILIIFPAIPSSIVIKQPAHALAFGIEDGSPQTGYNFYPHGLGVGTGGFAPGAELPSADKITFQVTDTNFFRAGNNNVLNISAIRNTFQTALQTDNALPSGTNISPSQFALQIVKTSEQVTLNPIPAQS